MAKFCTECGKEIADGVAFCTECGAKAPETTAIKAETVTDNASQPQTQTPQAYQAQQPYQQPTPQQTVVQTPAAEPVSKVVGTGTYYVLMLLYALPIIGIISVIVMASKAKNKNIKNFAKANLIWAIIAVILSISLIIGIIALGNSFMEYIRQALEGSLGDLPINP